VRKAASASEIFFSHCHSVRKFLKILSIYIVSRFWLSAQRIGRIIGETGECRCLVGS